MYGFVGVAEDTTVALVPEVTVETPSRYAMIPLADLVALMFANKLPNVCADVPPAEGVKIPIRLDGRELAVMVVVASVGLPDKSFGQGRTEEYAGDMVRQTPSVAVGLPGDIYQSVLVEV